MSLKLTTIRQCKMLTKITLQTNKSSDSPVSYRMKNGTIVRGLRSDQLLLDKKRKLVPMNDIEEEIDDRWHVSNISFIIFLC